MRLPPLFAALLLTVGCKSPTESNQPPGDPTAANSDNPSDPDPSEPSEPSDGATPKPGPPLPDGPLCDTNADCAQGMICEGVGCGPKAGRCVSDERMCTRDLAQYCGCDGQTFQGSGSCPGARYAYRGPCDPQLGDGEPCSDGRQCASGSCVGEGLEGCSPSAQGICGAVACTMDLASYCGCNGVEFQASGSCPNQPFAYRGPCEG
jgi:hypothetical protein